MATIAVDRRNFTIVKKRSILGIGVHIIFARKTS